MSACWRETRLRPNNSGYVYAWWEGARKGVHVHVWERYNGAVPPGMEVCHTCDVRDCYRLDHLFIGTPKDNAADCAAKGRQNNAGKALKGEHNPRAKLTAEQVAEIRSLPTWGKTGRPPKGWQGIGTRELAERYGVHEANIRRAIRGVTWKDQR